MISYTMFRIYLYDILNEATKIYFLYNQISTMYIFTNKIRTVSVCMQRLEKWNINNFNNPLKNIQNIYKIAGQRKMYILFKKRNPYSYAVLMLSQKLLLREVGPLSSYV